MRDIGHSSIFEENLFIMSVPLAEGREQAGKPGKPYGHDQLYDDYFKFGDYIDHPRGRVVWDITNHRAIIYIDPCINREDVLSQIIAAFDIGDYVVEYDDHYHCKKCVVDLFN